MAACDEGVRYVLKRNELHSSRQVQVADKTAAALAQAATGGRTRYCGYLKLDHRMGRCWLKGQLGDALHAVLCAAAYNLRWLMRAMVRLGLAVVFLRSMLCWLMATLSRRYTVTDDYEPSALAISGAVRILQVRLLKRATQGVRGFTGTR